MNKYYYLLMALSMAICTFSLTACGDDEEDGLSGPVSYYVGTWSVQFVEGYGSNINLSDNDYFEYLKLNTDGTYVDVSKDEDGVDVSYGKWKVTNDKLILQVSSLNNSSFTYDIIKKEKNKMTVTMWGVTAYMVKVSDKTIEKYL